MTAIRRDLTLEQGADYRRPFCITDENGDPVDLTGAVAALQIAAAYGFPPVLTLTTSNGGLVIDGPEGTITPAVGGGVTAALTPGAYVYDVSLVFAGGRAVRPYQGAVTVSPEVTTITPPYPPPAPAPGAPGQLNFSADTNSMYIGIGLL